MLSETCRNSTRAGQLDLNESMLISVQESRFKEHKKLVPVRIFHIRNEMQRKEQSFFKYPVWSLQLVVYSTTT